MEKDTKLSLIRVHLEDMNSATDDINTLEVRLDAERKRFNETKSLLNKEINGISKKLEKHVAKARPYFDIKAKESEVCSKVQRAASIFEKKKTILEMTKDQMKTLHDSLGKNTEIDAEVKYVKVIEQQLELIKEAEEDCQEAENTHKLKVLEYQQLQEKSRSIALEIGSSIKKAYKFYEKKEHLVRILNSQIISITKLQEQVQEKKRIYSNSMKNLETISEDIHRERSYLEESEKTSEIEKKN